MRLLITVCLVIFGGTITFGQSETSQTEIIIIGTIHTGNKHFNHQTLFKTLTRLCPDIILKEHSEKYRRVFGLKTATLLKIAKPSIELLALQKYSRINKDIKILPYDTIITSRKDYIKKFVATKDIFHDSLYHVKKSILDSFNYNDYSKKYNEFHNFINNASLTRINQTDIIEKSRKLHYLEEKQILPMGKRYIADSVITNQFQNEIKFWIARNNHMVKQILTYSKKFKGKRIIILTGLDHKYYLQDRLIEQEKGTIKIIELADD